jgi:hypothetical protein
MEQAPDRLQSHSSSRDNAVGANRPFAERLQDKDELPYYDPPVASKFLRDRGIQHSEQTLAKLRCGGGGPKFAYFGRFVRYREDWLIDYACRRISGPVQSTNEAKSPRQDLNKQIFDPATAAPADTRAAARRRSLQQGKAPLGSR